MSAIAEVSLDESERAVARPAGIKRFKPALVVGLAAAVLIAVALLLPRGHEGNGLETISALDLFVRAAAAEEALFSGDRIVHIVNQIVVKPVADPRWAQARWFPIVSLEATGKPRFDQLTLSAEVGKGYTVEDHVWCDPATARFIRVLSTNGTPIYANSFDGEAVYFLKVSADDGRRIARQPITKDFQPPKSPAELLGIAAGLPSRLSEEDKTPALDVAKVRQVTLDDGSEAYVLKVGYPQSEDAPQPMPNAYYLFTIRKDNSTIAQMEFVAEEQSLFVVRRVKTETVASAGVPWDLTGIERQVGDAEEKPTAGILANMVIPNVSVEHMVQKAGFETYLFSPDPPWTEKREIVDILDIPSPPNRAFAAAYRAGDGRHVVLWQAQSNKMVAEKVTVIGKVIHTSPSGVKLWSVPVGKWLAGILLQSARATIQDPPSGNRTGYVLETPAGTFPTLAVNGRLSDEELHSLIDSLVPAKECLEKREP